MVKVNFYDTILRCQTFVPNLKFCKFTSTLSSDEGDREYKDTFFLFVMDSTSGLLPSLLLVQQHSGVF